VPKDFSVVGHDRSAFPAPDRAKWVSKQLALVGQAPSGPAKAGAASHKLTTTPQVSQGHRIHDTCTPRSNSDKSMACFTRLLLIHRMQPTATDRCGVCHHGVIALCSLKTRTSPSVPKQLPLVDLPRLLPPKVVHQDIMHICVIVVGVLAVMVLAAPIRGPSKRHLFSPI
jgi:hypothetical protein